MSTVLGLSRMPHCLLDHLVIAAPTLEAGAEYVRQTLGVRPQTGGAHPRMGTHNLLLRLGESIYLEVIARNPDAPDPKRPRWFALDRLQPGSPPRLAAWVARTENIHASAAASAEPLGNIEAMSRGSLNWLITLPGDGGPPLDGIAPALIEWHTERHPAANLQDMRLSLIRLDAFHPEPQRITALLRTVGFQGPVSVLPPPEGTAPHLVAHIDTPQGPRELSAPQTT